jgi:hypothetical protein
MGSHANGAAVYGAALHIPLTILQFCLHHKAAKQQLFSLPVVLDGMHIVHYLIKPAM